VHRFSLLVPARRGKRKPLYRARVAGNGELSVGAGVLKGESKLKALKRGYRQKKARNTMEGKKNLGDKKKGNTPPPSIKGKKKEMLRPP